jgi:hypothetical protein
LHDLSKLKRLRVYFEITNHGFGHATYAASVVEALAKIYSDRQMDKAATLAHLQNLYNQQNQIVAQELELIKAKQVDLIFADIPSLAVAIAKSTRIPCWLYSNFGWEVITQN